MTDADNKMLDLLTIDQRANLYNAIAEGKIQLSDFTSEVIQDFIPAIILHQFPVVAYYNLPNGKKPEWLPLVWRGKQIDKPMYNHIQRIDCAIHGRDINEKRIVWGDFPNTGIKTNQ